MQHPITISFVKEKKEGRGEDSSPLSLIQGSHIYTGVFDGMGGAGASLYQTKEGIEHTGAYIASRLVCECVEKIIKDTQEYEINSLLKNLKVGIQEALRKEAEKYQSKEKSALRSSLLRTFPTTMALCSCWKDEKTFHIDSIWAGDSRNFILTEDGLFQISIDDLVTPQDPMENLKNDAPLSNCICSDRAFDLNHRNIQIDTPCCFFSATDGCFGYSLSPMHFEKMLLDCLDSSKTELEWEEKLCEQIGQITGDDFSFSASIIGFPDYKTFKEKLKKRSILLNKKLKECEISLEKIERYKEEIKEKETKLANKKKELENNLLKTWSEYKKEYMSKIPIE